MTQQKGSIPEYFYPLYKPEDHKAYEVMLQTITSHQLPHIIGTAEERNVFTKLLIVTGKIKDYRLFRDAIITQLDQGTLYLSEAIAFGNTIVIPRGVDPSWAIFIQDQRICEVLDQVQDTPLVFTGSSEEFLEFVLRYMLAQLLQDWRGPKLAVALESVQQKTIAYEYLNMLLSHWDFTGLFP